MALKSTSWHNVDIKTELLLQQARKVSEGVNSIKLKCLLSRIFFNCTCTTHISASGLFFCLNVPFLRSPADMDNRLYWSPEQQQKLETMREASRASEGDSCLDPCRVGGVWSCQWNQVKCLACRSLIWLPAIESQQDNSTSNIPELKNKILQSQKTECTIRYERMANAIKWEKGESGGWHSLASEVEC